MAKVKNLAAQEKLLATIGGKPCGWHETTMGVMFVIDDHVQFADDFDHFRNGFCRLLEISAENAKSLVEQTARIAIENNNTMPSEMTKEALANCLKRACEIVFPKAQGRLTNLGAGQSWGVDFQGAPADTIFAGSISGDCSRAVVGSREAGFAWLVAPKEKSVVSANSIEYDQTYFEDKKVGHFGYKDYVNQKGWRLEKASRLAKAVLDNVGPRSVAWLREPQKVSVLDVGSAVGFNRAAFADLGFEHFGIEPVSEAIATGREIFGFETWHGCVADLPRFVRDQKFTIITLWDVIEHIENPLGAIRLLKDFLRDDGVVVVRTPNLFAFEADILGDMYYSFKLDHISYFSVQSLNSMMGAVGLQPLYVESSSHLFKGLFGADYLFKLGKQFKGADLVAVYGLSK